MSNSHQAAARHVPYAHGKRRTGEARLQAVEPEREHASEMRLHAAVVVEKKKDVDDPCADVPCTD